MSTKVFAIIPARYGSTRFPGKPLVKIAGKTMIRWTYESSSRCKDLHDVIVATDDDRIFQEVQSWGGRVVMTKSDHPTGTDRIIEVVKSMGSEINPDKDIVINIQGDEPGIEAELIEGVVNLKKKRRDWVITTAATATTLVEAQDPNRIKVLFNAEGRAMYFSRAVIPHPFKKDSHFLQNESFDEPVYYRHSGIYCFNVDFLLKYGDLPASKWESLESLEQLRVMEAGFDIGVFIAKRATLSIDHPDDVVAVEKDLKERGLM
ncbi:MAG: 3-deoxy-manno-octulosonate cytidylyltransferase [Leptospira sp.]|nr:3-deoxy-manno-octulosonate cytidylyltransferase [Leptospira sp.]